MKRIVFPVSALFILLFGSSFIFPNQTSDEVRKLKSFDGIGIGVHADVFYTQGASHEIRIEGDERDVKDLVTEIENGSKSQQKLGDRRQNQK